MGRYVVVSERKRCGEPVDVPDGALAVSVSPAERPDVVRVAYLTPVHRIAIGPTRPEGVDVDKQ